MNFLKIPDNITSYREAGFKHGEEVVALLSGGDVKHGTLFFVEDYQTLFEVQLVIDPVTGKSIDLCDARISKLE